MLFYHFDLCPLGAFNYRSPNLDYGFVCLAGRGFAIVPLPVVLLYNYYRSIPDNTRPLPDPESVTILPSNLITVAMSAF